MLVIISGGIYIGYQYGPNFDFYLVPPTPKRDAMLAFNKISSTGIYTENQTQKNRMTEIRNDISNKHTYKEIYPLLKQALAIKGGKHASLITPSEVKKKFHNTKHQLAALKIISYTSTYQNSMDHHHKGKDTQTQFIIS